MVREKIMTMKILMLENHIHFTSMGMMKMTKKITMVKK